MASTPTKQFPLRLSPSHHRWVSLMAKAQEISMNEVIVRCIENENKRVRNDEPGLMRDMKAIIQKETSVSEGALGVDVTPSGKTRRAKKA